MNSIEGRSIRLFLADGTPHGLIITEIINWTGKVLSAPRGRMTDLLARPEARRTGLYLLLGPDPDRSFGQLAYIGETDEIGQRLRYHLSSGKLDFFDRVAVIVSSDDNLTKAHVRYVESRLIRLARQANKVSLANEREPDFQRLPEADKADMDFFVTQVCLILPTLGFDLFKVEQPETPDSKSNPIFVFETAGAAAKARQTEEGFVVLAGSTARRETTETFPAGHRSLRDRLVAEGLLVPGPTPDLLAFTADVPFSSPSAAAATVAGRSASGPREWKVENSGQTYREWVEGL